MQGFLEPETSYVEVNFSLSQFWTIKILKIFEFEDLDSLLGTLKLRWKKSKQTIYIRV